MLTYAEIISQHLALLKEEAQPASPERTERVKAFIAQMVAAGGGIADARQREQLRSILRYWSAHVYDQTGEFPPSQLAPPSPDLSRPRRPVWRWVAGLAGALILVALGAALISRAPGVGPASTLTPQALPSAVAARTGQR